MVRSRLIYLALLIGAFIFSQALYDSISLFTLALVLLIPMVSLLCLLVSVFLVKVTPDPTPVRQDRLNEFSFRIRIKSKTPLMLPMVRFNLAVNSPDGDASVPGYTVAHYRAFGETEVDIPLRFAVRGLYRVGTESVVFYDFLKLFRIKRKLRASGVVAVTPRVLRMEAPAQPARQEQESAVTAGGQETRNDGDMAGIRTFNEYDTLRQVHWKLSARLSQMIVKTYWENSCDNIMVLADLSAYENDPLTDRRLTDCVVEIAGRVTASLAEGGIRSTLGYADYSGVLQLQPITSPEEQTAVAEEFSMTPMLEHSNLQELLNDVDFSALQGGALYLVTSMPPEELEHCMEMYVRGLSCELQYLTVRPTAEPEHGAHMKVLTLSELEEG